MKYSSRFFISTLVVILAFSFSTSYAQGWLKKGLEEAKKQKDKLMEEQVKPHLDLAKDAVPNTKIKGNKFTDDKYGYTIEIPENFKPYRSGGLFVLTLKACKSVPPSAFPEQHQIELYPAEKPFFKDNNIDLEAMKAKYEKEGKADKAKVTTSKVMDYKGVKCVYMETAKTIKTTNVFRDEVTIKLKSRVYYFHLNGFNYQMTYTATEKNWEDFLMLFDDHIKSMEFFAIASEEAEGK